LIPPQSTIRQEKTGNRLIPRALNITSGIRSLRQSKGATRVFIGGGGKGVGVLVEEAGRRLPPGGVLVVNTVLLRSVEQSLAAMESIGMAAEVIQVQVSRSRPMPWSERMEALNPVWVVAGVKEGGGS